METIWKDIFVADDETHHVCQSKPIYQKKFIKVLKYHEPGLAPVLDESGAYHIDPFGNSLYKQRFIQTFGYYEKLAAVESMEGWFHIDVRGNPIYDERYAWCGNFQERLCVVQDQVMKHYFHINQTGQRVYQINYRYVGDFRDGIAVVCNENGLHTHINKKGEYIHGRWFLGLDVFHKSVARARDIHGWFHVNREGQPLYSHHYKSVEPYYNNIAHAEDFDGNLLTIDLTGKPITFIHKNNHSKLHELSAELVSFWKTQTIYAAVKLGIFTVLPQKLEQIAHQIKLKEKNCQRLLRALQELNLVKLDSADFWQLTEKGQLLQSSTSSMSAAAIVWGDSHYRQWMYLSDALRQSAPQTQQYFNELADNKDLLATYHQALQGYAEQDYQQVIQKINWNQHEKVIDAGGGTANLLHTLLNQFQHLTGSLLEMPAVIELIKPHSRCAYYSADLLEPWPCQADAIVLARVLHDWNDEQAIKILQNAKRSLIKQGNIYVLEMILDSKSASGGLLDLNMLVMTGGRERNLEDWQQLTSAADLKINQIIPISPIVNLLILSLK